MELFFEAERTGSGVMLVGAHAGPWELLGLFMQKHLNGSILYKPGRHADIEEMMLEKRRRAGAQLVPATSAGLRSIFKNLKSGKTVALLADQEPTLGEGQFAPYYGIETLTGVMRAATTAVNHGIEQCIEVAREQYLWAYKRFRNPPDGEKSLYMR
jgi:KDO2-lipid IV(A) lauroyltransferase